MNPYIGSKVILVEGLTGSGKSIMAHFIARQLQLNDYSANWVHEGEVPHPILGSSDTNNDHYMADARRNWIATLSRVERSNEILVLEASFFNNLLETLWAREVERSILLQFFDEIVAYIAPLAPTLIYLVQDDVAKSLKRNFERRGGGFRNFVIEFATSTALAKTRGWEGYEGMVQYWRDFVALTDALFIRFPGNKLKVDNTTGNWEAHNQEVLNYLSIQRIPEKKVSKSEALNLIGVYRARRSEKEFAVSFDAGELWINIFLNVRTRLIRQATNRYLAEGWHFVLDFEVDKSNGLTTMKIRGKDVDYLELVGTVADKVSA